MNLKENRVKKSLKEGRVCIGTMVASYRSPQIAQILAAAGWDYFIMDTEHSFFDYGALADIMTVARSEEIVPLVRVTANLYPFLARALDVGAMGLICPRVQSPEEVRSILESCSYPPSGQRGLSTSGIHHAHRGTTQRQYVEWANANTLVIVQPETETAVQAIEEIVSVPGVDGVMIGPNDLSLSLGVPGELKHPRMAEAYERVIAACNKFKVAPGVHLGEWESTKFWISRGMRFLTYRSDLLFLMEGARNAAQALREWVSQQKA
jgi:2-keto-3-deoxy-L-rhamnonate aldolase RhmA